MKRSVRTLSKCSLVAGVAALAATATITLADRPGGGGGGGGSGCPRNIVCTDHMDPVICSNGVTYANPCYAYRACATGCVPTGGGPVPVPLD